MESQNTQFRQTTGGCRPSSWHRQLPLKYEGEVTSLTPQDINNVDIDGFVHGISLSKWNDAKFSCGDRVGRFQSTAERPATAYCVPKSLEHAQRFQQ